MGGGGTPLDKSDEAGGREKFGGRGGRGWFT